MPAKGFSMPTTSSKSALLYKFGKRIFPALIVAAAYLSFTGCVLSESSGIHNGGTTGNGNVKAISAGTYDNGFYEDDGEYVYREQETFAADGSYEFVDYETSTLSGTAIITSYTQITGTWKQQDSTLKLTANHLNYHTTLQGEQSTDSTISPAKVSPVFRLTEIADSAFTLLDTDGTTMDYVKATKVVLSF